MADQTQAGDQSSSQGAGQTTQTESTSAQGSTSGASTQQSQQQTQATSQPAARPEYIPEAHWDGTAGKVKDDKALAAHFNEIFARDAAEQSRRLTLPKAADLKLDLPGDFVLPQGADFKIDADNPLWSQARSWAEKHGLSQQAFSEGIALIAGDRIGSAQSIKNAQNAEIAKLGATGTARVDAVTTFFKAHLGDADGARLASRLFTAEDVMAAEKLVARFASQGGGNFSRARSEADTGQKVTPEQWDKMTYTERKEYAARQSAAA